MNGAPLQNANPVIKEVTSRRETRNTDWDDEVGFCHELPEYNCLETESTLIPPVQLKCEDVVSYIIHDSSKIVALQSL